LGFHDFTEAMTSIRRSERQAKSLSLHLGYAVFRKATARLTTTQMQYILNTLSAFRSPTQWPNAPSPNSTDSGSLPVFLECCSSPHWPSTQRTPSQVFVPSFGICSVPQGDRAVDHGELHFGYFGYFGDRHDWAFMISLRP
jgi:hypothetical protein